MHEKVQEFLCSQKFAEKAKSDERKQKVLIDLGLFEKVYSPDYNYSTEYEFSEWNDELGRHIFYKRVPVPVTDEEYAEILKYSSRRETPEELPSNSVATAISVIAWIIYILGFFAGLIMGYQEETYYSDSEFLFAIASIYWCVAFISGTMLLGFAEIIKLLHSINSKK